MSSIFQVGAGSGGIVVLDLLARDPSVTAVSLIEPDVYKPHNVYRHLFPTASVGRRKADLAVEWVRGFRSDIVVTPIVADLTDSSRHAEFARLAAACDVGVCAVDNEPAKYAFDSLMRAAAKPWTLGEVLSGGIGGWVHRFVPGGPCYGCVASHLQRTVKEEREAPPPDYSNPGGPVPETTVPASKASIGVIASLHATVTLDLLASGGALAPRVLSKPEDQRQQTEDKDSGDSRPPLAESQSILFSLARVPGVFDEPFRTYRFRIPRSPGCLVCGAGAVPPGDLDVAVDEALDRLAPK